MERQFHIGDVLTVTTGRMVSTRGFTGLYEILDYMTGKEILTTSLTDTMQECKISLLDQFPQLDTPEMLFAVGELIEMAHTKSGKEAKNLLVLGWLSKLMCGKYGAKYEEMLDVKPLQKRADGNPAEEFGKILKGLRNEVTIVII